MGLERALPGKELLLGKLVTVVGFLESDVTAPHSSND
jgi:hypothetical protein